MQGQAGEILPLELDQIEDIIKNRRSFAPGQLMGLQQLKGRPSFRIQRSDFAVQDGFARGKLAQRLNDFGKSRRETSENFHISDRGARPLK